ncbi:hypothetical protein AHIS2_p077 [Acaryochloris phage A-HIS2]|nr:hypothetical protein AHIS2_p077 [Acaryochloris phage A-HIS2]
MPNAKFLRLLYSRLYREGNPGDEAGTGDPKPPAEPKPSEEPPAEPKPTEEPPVEPKEPPADPKPELTPEIQAELDQLREFKAKQDEAAEAARKAQLSEQERLQEELDAARAETAKANRDLLIKTAGVPDELLDLLPQDNLEGFLKSDKYAKLKEALEAKTTINTPKPKETPTDPPNRQSTPTPKKRTFDDLVDSDYTDLGNKLLGLVE